jgi:branched-chain amino acid aminotransferase
MRSSTFIWKNGELILWENATTHVLTHALHYGTSVFEGIRAYKTEKGPAIFRALEHYNRLQNSGKLIYMNIPYSSQEFIEATKHLIHENKLESCYIRPTCYFGFKEMGLNPSKNPVDTIIAAWEWGTYLGEEGLEKGIRCKISSYTRIDSRIVPPHAKSAANYLNSGLAKQEALRCGFDEAILLNSNGLIAEGPGENLFMVNDGVLYSPPASDCALKGITAQTIIDCADYLGIPFVYKSLIRDEILTADELFFTGTAAEVTPIREIDGITIGSGKRGEITTALQTLFFDCVHGKKTLNPDWLTFVKP